jgi:hypothetical protein
MANREVYPSSLFPLRGDLSAEAGATTVEVVGLRNIPISPTLPTDGQVYSFVAVNDDWEPTTVPFNQSIKVNGVAMSDDYEIFVNATHVSVNGSPI